MAHVKANLTDMVASNEGLSLFAIGEKSTVVKDVLHNILTKDTAVKGVILGVEGDPDLRDINEISSEHSIVMIGTKFPEIKGSGGLFDFKDINKEVMRRSPDLVLMGDIYQEALLNDAMELAGTGHKVIARTKARNIGSMLLDLVRLFPKEQQALKCYDLINTTNILVFEREEKTDVLVFDTATKEQLCKLFDGNGFDAVVMEEAINNKFMSQQGN